MGKDYMRHDLYGQALSRDAFELLSMGIEGVFFKRYDLLLEDPEYFSSTMMR